MISLKTQLTELANSLGPKETITPFSKSINGSNKKIVGETLKELYQEGTLIKRGPGEVYSLNPSPRRKPLECRGNFH